MSEPALLRPQLADPVAASAGVVSESEHESLRADIRRLTTMLGRTLSHHGGPELLELVEEVRRLSRQAPESGGAEITNALSGLDSGTAVALSRAFSQYFQLANTAEQLHRSRELRSLRPADHRPLRELMQRLAEAFPGEARAEVQAALELLELRPVFTAHPTESSRQSVLRVLRRVGEALDRGADDDELAGLVDLLWQTDEIRPGKPTVTDEASAIGWYLEQLARNTVPQLVGEFEREARAVGFTVPDDARPLVLGSWVGGDRDGNPFVTPDVTREVIALNADRALRIHLQSVEQLIDELSISTRVVGVSEELRGSLARDRRALPEVLRPLHPAQLERALPAQALLRPGPARGHPRADPRTARRTWPAATTWARRSTSQTCRCSTVPCASTWATGSPTAGWPARCARPRRSACTWPSSTSASTAASTTRRSGRSTTRSASWTSPTPS